MSNPCVQQTAVPLTLSSKVCEGGRKVSSSLTSPAQHLFFRAFLKITPGEGLYSQQGRKTREQREIGCLCILSDHEGMLVR